MKKHFNKNENFKEKNFSKSGDFSNDFAKDFTAKKGEKFAKSGDFKPFKNEKFTKSGEKFTQINELKNEIEALQYELSVVLEAILLLAGVKRECLENAVNAYIDVIDEVLESSTAQGADEILEVVNYLKIHKKELFG